MASPHMAHIVKIDRQGRAVIPQELRAGFVTTPGELIATRTDDGVLLRPVDPGSAVATAPDGLPMLRLHRAVTNAEVLAALDEDRASR